MRTAGRGGERWELAALAAGRGGRGHGITGVAPGGDGSVVVSRGRGDLVRYDVRTGGELGRVELAPRVVKGVVRIPDGYASIGVESTLIAVGHDLSAPRVLAPMLGRRVTRLGPDLLIARYANPTWRVHADGRSEPIPSEVGWVDMAGSPDDRWVAGLGEDGSVWRMDAAGQVVRMPGSPLDRSAVDVTRDGRVVAAGADQAEVWTLDGQVTRYALPGVGLTELVISPDDRWVVVGGIDGALRVHAVEDFALVASFAGHTERIAALEFDPDGVLWSGSWDETARVWDLSPLDRSASELLGTVDAAWDLDVAEALRAAAP